jgi:methyl-accepting chemotaxis protein
MKWFYNLKIQAKMLISFFIIITLMIALSVFVITQMNSVVAQNTYANRFTSEERIDIMEFQSHMRELHRLVATMAMYAPLKNAENIDPLINDSNTVYDMLIFALDKYDERINNDTVISTAEKNKHNAITEGLREDMRKYKSDICDTVANYARNGRYNEAINVISASAALIAETVSSTQALLDDATAEAAIMEQNVTATVNMAKLLIIITAGVSAVIAALIALFIANLISKPLITLSGFMKKAGATGDITLSPDDTADMKKYAQNKDELGQTLSGAVSFVNHVSHIAIQLENVAQGVLTDNIQLLSDTDTMGMSMAQMIDNLNDMFTEIQSSAYQVSLGAKQVADGAQSLAQGATEQAASIEELSDSINEIAENTKANAATAGKTSKLSEKIKTNAEKGSRQMNEMIEAVEEINEAGKNISKIINTIDDIAFQTNILALNAAVEAARAGQHGKGFAVVAEEVRNLASKSAEAAKNTGSMIQNSMDKAELGSRIAGETAASLMEIVSGINDSAQMIMDMAKSSEEQSHRISQINIGVEQVSHVVQQNSATAEQSAAASEEMSGQSDTLQHLISKFKLKDGDAMQKRLPSFGGAAQKRHPTHDDMKFAYADAGSDGKY